MGSPLGPTLAKIFLCHYETTWLKNCQKPFKPVYYKRHVDDIFVFEKREQVLQFVNYMNKRHKNIKFLFETEKRTLFLLSMLRFGDEKIKLQQVFSQKMCSVLYTLVFNSFL